MLLADWIIAAILIAAVAGGLAQGFLRSACSLLGLVLGLVLAAWNYTVAAKLILPLVRFQPVANAVGFLLIAVLVMAVANLSGKILSKTVHAIGLGCLDRLAGAAFGLFQGALLVTALMVATMAFFPHAEWLSKGTLPHYFYGMCRATTHMSPQELANRVRSTLEMIENHAPAWLGTSTENFR